MCLSSPLQNSLSSLSISRHFSFPSSSHLVRRVGGGDENRRVIFLLFLSSFLSSGTKKISGGWGRQFTGTLQFVEMATKGATEHFNNLKGVAGQSQPSSPEHPVESQVYVNELFEDLPHRVVHVVHWYTGIVLKIL